MAGFLDSRAPSIQAEYLRYLDGDILGKLIFKNFLVNIIGLSADDIYIPLGTWGDIGVGRDCRADAQFQSDAQWLDVEIKCAHINIANRTRGDLNENWAFTQLLKTPKGTPRKYDLAFAVGIRSLGFEDPRYWPYLEEHGFEITRLPHESQFLNRCGFLVMPFSDIPKNYFRVTLPALPKSQYFKYFAWGREPDKCLDIWNTTIRKIRKGS